MLSSVFAHRVRWGRTADCGAASLGLTKAQTYRLVVLPQALVTMIPSFGNLLMDLVKATSPVSLITITELTFSGRHPSVSASRPWRREFCA
ncbi:ABC transporter permease subunit [Mesorhizobium australicum]|uniref:ABC transporter permease subunit n=1 Tax=Mesorhizobium australicum TaxID=536018 RepID=UPI00333ADE77